KTGSAILAVQPAFAEPPTVVVGDLGAGRGQQEHLVGDALHVPLEPVAEAAAEVDETPRQGAVDALEGEDHRLVALEGVGHLLDVVEPGGVHDVGPAGTGARTNDTPPGIRVGARGGRDHADPAVTVALIGGRGGDGPHGAGPSVGAPARSGGRTGARRGRGGVHVDDLLVVHVVLPLVVERGIGVLGVVVGVLPQPEPRA